MVPFLLHIFNNLSSLTYTVGSEYFKISTMFAVTIDIPKSYYHE